MSRIRLRRYGSLQSAKSNPTKTCSCSEKENLPRTDRPHHTPRWAAQAYSGTSPRPPNALHRHGLSINSQIQYRVENRTHDVCSTHPSSQTASRTPYTYMEREMYAAAHAAYNRAAAQISCRNLASGIGMVSLRCAINNVLTKKERQSLSTLARYQGKKGHAPRKLRLSVNVLRQLGTPHVKAPYSGLRRRVQPVEMCGSISPPESGPESSRWCDK
jgi:hypothetical protein